MNKIKQTEQNLKQIKKILQPDNNSNLPNQSIEELLKQSNQILQQKQQKVRLQQDPRYLDSKNIVEKQLKEREKYFQYRKLDLENLLLCQIESDLIDFQLLNSMMQKLNIKYDQINPIKLSISLSNKLNNSTIQSRKTSSKYPSIFNMQQFNKSQSLFSQNQDSQSIDLNDIIVSIDVYPYKQNNCIIREDKFIYEVQIIENQTHEEEQIEIIFDQIIEKQELKYKFTFLNKIENIDLNNIDISPSQYFSQVNMYRIFREIIIEAIDHVSISQINIFSQSFEEYELPSKYFRQQLIENEPLDSPLSSQEKRIKLIEKQVQTLAQKINQQKNEKLQNTSQLYSISVEQLKDYRIQMIPHNQGYQAQRAIKDHLKETSNINIQAGTKQGRGGIDKMQKAEYFLKQKGQKQEFHKCWLEQRGFHLLWYHSKSDKIARGIGQLDDIQIKDIGSVYEVRLLDRSLFIKLEKPYVGQIWRKAISNQIAYKVYLNNLWLNCRLFDKSPKITMIDYFFNENAQNFNIKNNALLIEYLENALPLNYIINYTQTIFDSLINHKITEINLSNSKLGPNSLIQLLQYFQSNKNRLIHIDLSDCNITIEVLQEFAKFLLNKNSFALNQIHLNNNQQIGNEGIEIISNAIYERYNLYWEKNGFDSESVSPGYRRHKMMKNDRIDLELLTDFNLRNIGVTNFDSLFNAISLMFQKVVQMQSPEEEEEIVLNKSQTLSQIMKKLKNKPGQFNRHNIRILKNFYDNELDQIVDIIKIQLDISENLIQNFNKLGELIAKQDCFTKLQITNIEIEEFQQFSNYLNNSVALETLNINFNKIIDIPLILDSLSQNRSIKTLIITQTYIDLESRFEKRDLNNQQFYIAEIKQL